MVPASKSYSHRSATAWPLCDCLTDSKSQWPDMMDRAGEKGWQDGWHRGEWKKITSDRIFGSSHHFSVSASQFNWTFSCQFYPFLLHLVSPPLFYYLVHKAALSMILVDLAECNYSQFNAAMQWVQDGERQTVGYIFFSGALLSLDSGSIETEAQHYSQPPFPALICLFSSTVRPLNIWEKGKKERNTGTVRC